jgi:kumamolisin
VINPHRAYISRATLQPQELAAPMDFEVALKMRNFSELQTRVARGERISAGEITAKYSPHASDYQAVADWLTGQGLAITRRDPSRIAVFARGSVAQVEKALQVPFARVTLEGTGYTSAIGAPSVPAGLAPLLVGVNGLQPHLHPHKHIVMRKQSLTGTSEPYLPSQILQAYQANTLTNITGSGQAIAIVIDVLPQTSDLTSFWSTYGVNQFLSNITFTQVVPAQQPLPDLSEASLDTEWSSSIAPGAKVRVYAVQSLSDTNLDEAYAQVYSDASVQPSLEIHQMSMSYGSNERGTTISQADTDDQYFAELAAAGVTIFASSGDGASTPGGGSSTDTTGPLAAENPASDPNVTGVGGTSLTLNSSGNEATETAWSNSGGGSSDFFVRPSWQTGSSLPGGTMRLVPDVACSADPNEGAVLIVNGATEIVGGTSWSSPTWAGFCALINQVRANASLGSIGALGRYLYPLAGTSSFRDITVGTNALGGNSAGRYVAGAGYDEVTGLGVPLVQALSQSLVLSAPPLVTISSPQTVVAGANATFTVAASGTYSSYSYQWQRLPFGTTTWSNLSNTSVYAGATTASLTVSGVTSAMSGDEFQCVVTFAGVRTVQSLATTLIIDSPPLTTITLAGSVGNAGLVNGTGTAAEFNYPSGLSFDSSGNVYIADFSNNVIREVTPAGVVTTPYGSTSGTAGSTNGTGNAAGFNQPNSIATGSSNTFYIADTGNNTIRKISGGVVSTMAGKAGTTGYNNASGTTATFNAPNGVAVDGSGNVYVADTNNDLIRKISATGSVSTLAGSAQVAGYLDGTGTAAQFDAPTGVTVDSAGNVYVADFGNNVVRKITSAGVVTTYAGQVAAEGYADGAAANAVFNAPVGVWIDSSNNLYVSDSLVPPTGSTAAGNDVLRKVTPGGIVSTIAGDPEATGSSDGKGTAAQFYSLQYAMANSAGVFYLVDTFNHTLREAGVAVSFTPQPVSQVITVGQPVAFSATASGSTPLSYQWLFNGTAIAGATSATYAISSVTAANAGDYTVRVTNPLGTATSSAATLVAVTAQPVAQTVTAGQALTLSVSVAGTGSSTYQWLFNGTPIAGATGSTYTIASVSSANAGSYAVTVTDSAGNATTTAVMVTVNAAVAASSSAEPTMPQWMLILLGALLVGAAWRQEKRRGHFA